MASGTLGENESRERQRWGDGNKVYRRRFYNKKLKNNTAVTASIVAITGSVNTDTANNGNTTTASATAPATSNNGNKDKDPNNNNSGFVRQLASQTLAAEEAKPSQQQQTLPPVVTVSDDSLSHDRPPQLAASNGCEPPNKNGAVDPIITRLDNRVRINLKAVRSKNEVRQLKRKLLNELDQVRSVAKQLEAKEVQLSAYCAGSAGAGGYNHPEYPASVGRAVMGGNSELASVGHDDPRPFRKLSVSVMENTRGVGEFVEKEKRTPKANQYYQNSEFLLGKDRLPPAESNKKLKSKGRKKLGREMRYGFGIDKYTDRALKSCNNLLSRLMKHKHAWVFNKPVDAKALGLRDYHDIIKHPMDLGTVKNRLAKNWYKSPREFMEDVRLTFHNAMTYNPKGQDVYIMAEELSKIFEGKWLAIESEYSLNWRYEPVHYMGLPTPTSRKVHPPPPALPFPAPELRTWERAEAGAMNVGYSMKPHIPVGRTPAGRTPAPKKPKANDPDKRDMTFDEKQRLITNLQNLPPEKVDSLVHIIKKRNSALSQSDEEIELDIDKLDTETLWELDRFVTNYKKSLSKSKRKAELALQARVEATPAVLATNSAPNSVGTQKESKIDEMTVTNSSLAQGEKQRDNSGGSSSYSSSSGDSSSSSSDSDSDSSSADESDSAHSPRS